MSNEERTLPVINPPTPDDEPSCSPKIYVSNEEAALIAELRSLREASLDIRRRLEAADEHERTVLESELEELRRRRGEVARRREGAFTRKMIMLGHLPPDHPIEG
jgi:hypothetical protein